MLNGRSDPGLSNYGMLYGFIPPALGTFLFINIELKKNPLKFNCDFIYNGCCDMLKIINAEKFKCQKIDV